LLPLRPILAQKEEAQMRRKMTRLGMVVLCVAGLALLLQKNQMLYTSHASIVNDTIVDLLEDMDGYLPNPTERIDLHGISRNPSPDARLFQVVAWRIENAAVANTVSIGEAIMDDDPVYGLKATIQVTYTDGSEATLAWESWRYGIVLGPLVLGKGNGPPGYVTVAPSE
jgi:hypothetical protein